jgi:hypothetical protein
MRGMRYSRFHVNLRRRIFLIRDQPLLRNLFNIDVVDPLLPASVFDFPTRPDEDLADVLEVRELDPDLGGSPDPTHHHKSCETAVHFRDQLTLRKAKMQRVRGHVQEDGGGERGEEAYHHRPL